LRRGAPQKLRRQRRQ